VCHHERWNGCGYPAKLKGEQIPVDARITTLVDVYDALSNKRCFKHAWPEDEVRAYIRDQRGIHFDPALVDLFFQNFDSYSSIMKAHPDKPLEPFRARPEEEDLF